MLGDIPDAPSTGLNIPKEQGRKSHLQPLKTVKVALKLKEVTFL